MADEPRQPHYDKAFGELCRILMKTGMEMHTPRKGESYLTRRPSWKPLHPFVRES